MRLPCNREIRDCFEKLVMDYFSDANPGHVRISEKLFSAFVAGDAFSAESILSRQLMRFMTLRDAGERIYHGMLLGMFADVSSIDESKDVKSNVEAGDGFQG